MKKFFVKAAATLVAAFFVIVNLKAQVIVNNISTSNFGACKEYLEAHPADTIRSSSTMVVPADTLLAGQNVNAGDTLSCVVSVFKTSEGKIARHQAFIKVTGKTVALEEKTPVRRAQPAETVNVVKEANRVGAVTSKKDTLWYDRTSSNKVSFDDKVAVNRGEKTAIDPEHKDLNGNFRHRRYFNVLGGGTLLNNGDIHPVFSARLGYETCHFLFELDGTFSQANYTTTAEAEGRYNTFAAYLAASWKMWQSPLYRSYLAVGLAGGFAYQKTDAKEAEFYSSNYGASGKAFLRGLWGLNRNFGFVFEGGYHLLPEVKHFGGEQEWEHGGAYLQAGVNYKF